MEFSAEQINDKIKELKRAYARSYAAQHKEQRKEQQRRCWERKAIAALEQEVQEQSNKQ